MSSQKQYPSFLVVVMFLWQQRQEVAKLVLSVCLFFKLHGKLLRTWRVGRVKKQELETPPSVCSFDFTYSILIPHSILNLLFIIISSDLAAIPWTLSFWDRDSSMAVTPDGLRCQSRATNWQGCRATKAVQSSGKYYYEATVTDEGLCRVGWSTAQVKCVYVLFSPCVQSLMLIFIALGSAFQAVLDLGTDHWGYGFGGTGKKSNNKNFDSYGESFGMNDTIGCYLDLDNSEVSFSKNGKHLGKAFSIADNARNKSFHPAVVLKVLWTVCFKC